MRFVLGSIVAAGVLAILRSSFAKVSSIWVGSWACSSEGTDAAGQGERVDSDEWSVRRGGQHRQNGVDPSSPRQLAQM